MTPAGWVGGGAILWGTRHKHVSCQEVRTWRQPQNFAQTARKVKE